MLLLLIPLLCCGASAQEAPSAESVAIRQAREEYRRALERHVAYGLLGGSLGDERSLELEKEALEAGRHYRELAAKGSLRPARLKELPAPPPASSSSGLPAAGPPRGIGKWGAGAAGLCALVWGLRLYRRRPRELRCMPCGQRLRVKGKSGTVRLRCPKCRSESVFKL